MISKHVPRTNFVVVLLLALAPWAGSKAQKLPLGEVSFPTSGGPEAQAHFLRGVAALHSFWYEEALKEFQEAARIEPDFAMAYWGQAMSHNHPIWGDPQNTESARQSLAQIKNTQKLTSRERAYIDAVKALYGQGDKPTRDRLYAEAMQQLWKEHPDDVEAAAFYALSLLGSAAPGPPGLRRRMEAAAIALDIARKKPDHPGAAHYVIHAFDDPDHAILALSAARRYAKIAPEAYHALHMPSHIFLQLGMWPEAAASNEAAWAASEKAVTRNQVPAGMRDYHSLHWLTYIYLQQGRYREAEDLLKRMRNSLDQLGDDPFRRLFALLMYSTMAASFVTETERWDLAEEFAVPYYSKLDMHFSQSKGEGQRSRSDSSGSHSHAAIADPKMAAAFLRAPLAFAQAFAAANKGEEARESIAELEKISKLPAVPMEALRDMPKVAETQRLEIAAAFHAANGKFDEAIQYAKKATEVEKSLPAPVGPPALLKPSYELYGEILLRAGKADEAHQQFMTSLTRHPNRARSLLGAARAAAKRGDTTAAASAYAKFAEQWKSASTESAELAEARKHSKGAAK